MPDHTDPEWLREAYHGEGMTQEQMGVVSGVSHATIGYHMEKHCINTRGGPVETEDLLDDVKAVAQEHGEPLSAPQYNQYGSYTHATIHKRFGSWRKGCAEADVETYPNNSEGVDARLRDYELLAEMYETLSSYEIAAELGCSPPAVQHALHRANVETRPSSRHHVYCDVLECEVDSRVERQFARGLNRVGLLGVSQYHPSAVATSLGRWEPDFRVGPYLVECKDTAPWGYYQAGKLGMVGAPVLLYGAEADAHSLYHDLFIEFERGVVPDLSELAAALD